MMNLTLSNPINEKFEGSWNLVSYELWRSGDEVGYPMGRNAVGLLMYNVNGHMSVQVMRIDRPKSILSGHLDKNTSEKKKRKPAFESYVAYFGTYEVKEEEGTITHYIVGSLHPNLIGTAQKRFFKFSDDQLTLSTPPILVAGKQQIARIIWNRTK